MAHRTLIGNRPETGEAGLWVSKPGANVLDPDIVLANLTFDSSSPLDSLRIIQTGTFQIQCKKTYMGKKGNLEICTDEQMRANADYTKRYPFELDTQSDTDFYAESPVSSSVGIYGYEEGQTPFVGEGFNQQYVQNVYCDYGTTTIEFNPPLPKHIKIPYISVFFAVANSSGHFHPWYANVTCTTGKEDYEWQYANSQHCVHMDSAWFRGKWTFRERAVAPFGTDLNNDYQFDVTAPSPDKALFDHFFSGGRGDVSRDFISGKEAVHPKLYKQKYRKRPGTHQSYIEESQPYAQPSEPATAWGETPTIITTSVPHNKYETGIGTNRIPHPFAASDSFSYIVQESPGNRYLSGGGLTTPSPSGGLPLPGSVVEEIMGTQSEEQQIEERNAKLGLNIPYYANRDIPNKNSFSNNNLLVVNTFSFNQSITDLNSPSSIWGGTFKSFAGLQGLSYFANSTHLKIDGFMTPTHSPTPFETEIVKTREANPKAGQFDWFSDRQGDIGEGAAEFGKGNKILRNYLHDRFLEIQAPSNDNQRDGRYDVHNFSDSLPLDDPQFSVYDLGPRTGTLTSAQVSERIRAKWANTVYNLEFDRFGNIRKNVGLSVGFHDFSNGAINIPKYPKHETGDLSAGDPISTIPLAHIPDPWENMVGKAWEAGYGLDYKEKLPRSFRTNYWDGSSTEFEWWPIGHANGSFTIAYQTANNVDGTNFGIHNDLALDEVPTFSTSQRDKDTKERPGALYQNKDYRDILKEQLKKDAIDMGFEAESVQFKDDHKLYVAATYGDYSPITYFGVDNVSHTKFPRDYANADPTAATGGGDLWDSEEQPSPFWPIINKGTRFSNQLPTTEAKGYPPNSQYEPGDAFLKTRTFQGQPTSLDSFWNSFSNNMSQWVSSNTPYGEFYYTDGGYAMDVSSYYNYAGQHAPYSAEKVSLREVDTIDLGGGNKANQHFKVIKFIPSDWNSQRQSLAKHNWNGGNPKAGIGTEGRRFGFGGAGSAEALGGEGPNVFDTYIGKYIIYDLEGGNS